MLEDKKDKIVIADTSEQCDMIWLAADLYNIEKHLAYTVMKIAKENPEKAEQFLLVYNEIRKHRTQVIADVLKLSNYKTVGDSWCVFKHLVGSLMQSSEVGIREVYKGNTKEAMKYFKLGNDLWETIWIILELGKVKNEH